MKINIIGTLFLALALGFSTSAFARIGESKEEILERYGEPVDKEAGYSKRQVHYSFIKGDFKILVTLLDGESHQEFYTKLEGGDITRQEMQLLLQANGGGKSWEEQNLQGNFIFEQKDKLEAFASGKQMFVQTLVHKKFEEDAKAEAERKNLEGF